MEKGVLQALQLVHRQVRKEVVQPHRQEGDDNQETGPGHHLGILRIADEQERRYDTADQEVNYPESPPERTEDNQVQAGDDIGDLGLVAHEELQGLQEEKAEENHEDHVPQGVGTGRPGR